ncbi:MAG: hypothetical protein JRG96_14080, partial [Deltaproteobacteria bacterium]|nr:hypothetical protein [Deltaproteobacteria bacterium]
MTDPADSPGHDSLRWGVAALLLTAATALCFGLLANTPAPPARLTTLLALPILVSSVLCFARRAPRWARWLAIYGWVAALALYLEGAIVVWPFGALTQAVIAALALASSLLIPNIESRDGRRAT